MRGGGNLLVLRFSLSREDLRMLVLLDRENCSILGGKSPGQCCDAPENRLCEVKSFIKIDPSSEQVHPSSRKGVD
jgi:hypothetical protein